MTSGAGDLADAHEQEVQALRDELREERRQLRLLSDAAPDVILALDRDGRILAINHVTPGFSRESILGTLAYDFVPREHAKRLRSAVETVFATQRTVSYEIPGLGPHGTKAWYSSRIGPALEDGRVVAATLITRDITERRRDELELERARRDLEAAVAARTVDLERANELLRREVEHKARLAEEAVAREAQLQAAFDTAASGAAFVDAATRRFLRVNTKLCELTGYTSEELLERTFLDITLPEDRERDLALFSQTMASPGATFEREKRYQRKDGSVVWAHVAVAAVRDRAGQVVSAFAVLQDITQRKRWEVEREYDVSLLEATIESTADGILVVDRTGRMVRLNQKFIDLWRIPPAVLEKGEDDVAIAFVLDQLVDPGAFVARVRALYDEPEASSFDLLEFKDGRFFERYSRPQRVGEEVVGRVWSFRDVSERKRFERLLSRSEARLRAIIESEPECVQLVDDDGTMLETNPAGLSMFEATDAAQLVGRPIDTFVAAPYREAMRALLGQVCEGKRARLEFELVGRRRTRRWMDMHAVPHHDEERGRTVILAVTRDITGSKLAELALSRAHDDARYLADASRQLAGSLDYRATVGVLARVAVERLGEWCAFSAPDENGTIRLLAVATTAEGASGPLEGERVDDVVPEQIARAIRRGEWKVLHGEELESHAAERSWPFRQADARTFLVVPLTIRERPIGSLLVGAARPVDAGDQTLAQELAHRAAVAVDNAFLYQESLRAIRLRDEFIAVASHELRTPLTPLKMQISVLERHLAGTAATLPNGQELMRLLRISDRQVDRIARLVEGMLDGSRLVLGDPTLSREELDLVELVASVAQRCRAALASAGCELRVDAPRHLWGRWDRLRLEQVVVHLLTNAMRYGAGAPIEVRLTRHGEVARLSVRDHGIGIEKADQKRVFDLFERAAPWRSYGGMGLGLYITRRIVEAHGGTIRVESEIGEGATFVVEVPRTEAGRGGGRAADRSAS